MIVILVMAMTMMDVLRDLALRARRVGRHMHELAVQDATLGDDMLAEMLHRRRSCPSAPSLRDRCRDRDEHVARQATARDGRDRRTCQAFGELTRGVVVDIDQRSDAIAGAPLR